MAPPAVDRHVFRVGENPEGSRLAYVLSVPVAGEAPLVLACGVDWPFGTDAYCHPLDAWPDGVRLVAETPVERCWRSGKAVHLHLRRRARRRSMFVWTESHGRTLVFWRTQATMTAARPSLKVPQARGLEAPIPVAVDVRERHPWRFAKQKARLTRRELPAGDYGVFHGPFLRAVVERKSPANLAGDALSGGLAFALAELEKLPRACLVVEGRLSDVLKAPGGHAQPGWLLSVLAALQVEHPSVPWIFAETRALAEDYAYRWLAAAVRAAPRGTAEERAGAPAAVGDPAPAVAYQAPLFVNDREARLTAALALARDNRVWTSRAYAENFGVSASTAYADLKALVDAGSLIAEGRGRGRRYRSP